MTTKVIYERNKPQVLEGTPLKPKVIILFTGEYYRTFLMDTGNYAYVVTSAPDLDGYVKTNVRVLDSLHPKCNPEEEQLNIPGVKEMLFARSGWKEKE